MSFGFGPGNAMQRDYNRNRSMLSKRKDLKEINATYGSKDRQAFNDKSLSDEELQAFRAKLQQQKKKETLRLAILFTAVFLLVSTCAWLILN